MNPEDPKDEQPGPSRKRHKHDLSVMHYPLLDLKVEKLLKEDCFAKGLPLTDKEINSSILELEKDKNIFNSNLEYKYFLNKYGSLYGAGFDINGPISNDNDGEKLKMWY